MNIVVLAAGMGKRMNSDRPKVMHHLGGKPLLAHVLDCARSLMPNGIFIVYGHGGEQVPEAFAAADLKWAKQEPQLGTGHAVMQAAPMLDDSVPTLVLYGDVPLVSHETLMRLQAKAGSARLALLTVEVDDPSGYGRIVREGERIVRIVEHKDADDATRKIREINTGILVAPTGALKRWLGALSNDNAQREYYLTDIIAAAVADGVAVVSSRPIAEWETRGVNSKVQLAELERVLQRNQALQLMEAGVTLADPARLDIRGSLLCGRDVEIDINCVFEGNVQLGDGVRIGANCVLRNAQIGAGTELLPFTHVDGASVGAQARIGPYARLRPGTELGDHTHVGNFVEMKNAKVAAQSKANHLAYIGDAVIGQRVNIGAGTITANYDGVDKHRTRIGDGAFIGSDCMLIAPVEVGARARTAAGSVVTHDVPEGALVVGAPARIRPERQGG